MNITQKKCFHQLYSKPILFAGLLILLAGIYSYTQMQTNLFPEVLFPRITVIADAGQQPVDRMMITVTKPLESAVKKGSGSYGGKKQYKPGKLRCGGLFQLGTGHLRLENTVGKSYKRGQRISSGRDRYFNRSDESIIVPGIRLYAGEQNT